MGQQNSVRPPEDGTVHKAIIVQESRLALTGAAGAATGSIKF